MQLYFEITKSKDDLNEAILGHSDTSLLGLVLKHHEASDTPIATPPPQGKVNMIPVIRTCLYYSYENTREINEDIFGSSTIKALAEKKGLKLENSELQIDDEKSYLNMVSIENIREEKLEPNCFKTKKG